MRLCRCGHAVNGRCPRCQPSTSNRDFYGSYRWRKLSEAKRAADPLCERCTRSEPATEVHHIKSVIEYPMLKWEWSNLMSVCVACHRELDGGRAESTGGIS